MPEQERRENRILFVDDESSIVATLPPILRKFGFDVTAASTVPDAINAIKTRNFDLLLCDLNINAMRDGFDVVDAMRVNDPRCPVIILTGYPDWQSAVEAIHHRVDDYVVKPADTDELVRTLKQSIAARQQPKARILSVSNDEPLLLTRHLLLQHEGMKLSRLSESKLVSRNVSRVVLMCSSLATQYPSLTSEGWWTLFAPHAQD